MEAFVAIGLISNITSFIDFTGKLFSGSIEIYRPYDGRSDSVSLNTALLEELKRIRAGLKKEAGSDPSLQECKRVCAELEEALNKLKAKRANKRLDSFVAALKQVWKEDKIDKLVGQLKTLKDALNSGLMEQSG